MHTLEEQIRPPKWAEGASNPDSPQEKERGRFNEARDGASRTLGRARERVAGATTEQGGVCPSTGQATGSAL